MKKGLIWICVMILAAVAAVGCAEQAETFFARLEGMEWTFCSGVGGWSTDLWILPDGSFTGEYHDSEMGECDEAYPHGTLYYCSFTGRMSLVEQVDENTWRIRVDELKETDRTEEEVIEDGLRLVYTQSYGITEGDEMLLYQPGTPVDGFTDEMKLWAHLYDDPEGTPSELQTWFLSSEKNDSGFVGIPAVTGVSLANPWLDLDAEQLRELAGKAFRLPEGAENAVYRWLDSERMAEIQFTWNSGEYCFRAKPVMPEQGDSPDISGLYYDWESEEEVSVGGYSGYLVQAKTGSEEWTERCQWYDEDAGMTYALSVTAADVDGLDLTAVAEQICYSAEK